MDRVLKQTPATVTCTFYEDGAAVDPGTVTVTVTSEAGQSLAGGTASGTGASARTFTLSTATHTALLDNLTLSWASTSKGTLVTYVQVAGGFLFSLPDLDSIKLSGASGDTIGTRFTIAERKAMRTLVEVALEDECGKAFVPRYARKTVSGDGCRETRLARKVRSIRSITFDGQAIADISTITPTLIGADYPIGWRWGVNNYVVGYEHGYDFPPARVSRAGVLLAKRWLIEGPVDDRATSMSNDTGTYQLVTPGMAGAMFDIPEVNAVVNRYSATKITVA